LGDSSTENKFVIGERQAKSVPSEKTADERRAMMGASRQSCIHLSSENKTFSYRVLSMAPNSLSKEERDNLAQGEMAEGDLEDLPAENSSLATKQPTYDVTKAADFVEMKGSKKTFRWFIALPFEFLEFLTGHTLQMTHLMTQLSQTGWSKEYNAIAQQAFSKIEKLQNQTSDAITSARFASTKARLEQISDFTFPDYDSICGDGPLRMLFVEGNVVLLKNSAVIERHLLMFTDMILILRRNPRDGKWYLHQDFGGLIYFGLVKEVEEVVDEQASRIRLKFVDVNLKSERLASVEFLARHEGESALWHERFTERIEANHMVFGKPISEVLAKEEGEVPYIVRVTINEMMERGTEAEGIFRLAGNLKRARYLRVLFDKGMNRYVHPDVLKGEQVHTLAALLKMYLRELPEPLFAPSQYTEVMEQRQKGVKAKRLLKQMKPEHCLVLQYVMRLLRLVALNAEKTKMSSYNLAVVFSPNLFQPPKGEKETPESIAVTTTAVQSIIDYFIRHPEVLEEKAGETKDE